MGATQNGSEQEMTLRLGQQTNSLADEGLLSKLIVQDEQDEVFLKEYHLPTGRSHHYYDRQPVKSYDHGHRYSVAETERPAQNKFSRQGGLTTRHQEREQLVLPKLPMKSRGSVGEKRSFHAKKKPYGL